MFGGGGFNGDFILRSVVVAVAAAVVIVFIIDLTKVPLHVDGGAKRGGDFVVVHFPLVHPRRGFRIHHGGGTQILQFRNQL